MKLTQGVNFHQHFMPAFFVRKSFWQLFSTYVTREKLPKRLLYEKGARKMLMKLTTGPACTV